MKLNLDIKTVSKLAIILATTSLISAGCNQRTNTLKRPDGESNNNASQTTNSNNPSDTSQANTDDGEVAGSVTPLPTKKIAIANHELSVEVADNDTSREQGLSGRDKLDDGNGMLFDFTNTSIKTPGFWMKDMQFPIDIIWINNGKIIGVQENAPLPPQDSDLPVYNPPSDITHVLEVPAGWYKKNNLSIGSIVQL